MPVRLTEDFIAMLYFWMMGGNLYLSEIICVLREAEGDLVQTEEKKAHTERR